jgi:hypothetical protein
LTKTTTSKVASRSVAVLVFVLADIAAVMIFPDQNLSPLAYLDYRSCLDVDIGQSDAEVLAIMGQPLSRVPLPTGEQQLVYGTQTTADGPVAINLKSNRGELVVGSTACHGLE